MGKARTFLRSLFGHDHDEAALSRRDILAGIGLAGLLVAAPKLLTASVAEAKTFAPAGEPEAGSTDAANRKGTEDSVERSAAADTEVTDLSARRYWRRRYWRRRYYRRRYWRRRYWRRRYWRRRYW